MASSWLLKLCEEAGSYSKLVVSSTAVAELEREFAGIPSVIPVCAFGQPGTGKCSVLNRLLGESLFTPPSEEVAVSCCLRATPVGSSHVLLLHVSGFPDLEKEVAGKLLYIALSLCGVGLLLTEPSTMFQWAKAVARIHETTDPSAKCSEILLFCESLEALKRGKAKAEFENFSAQPAAQLFDLVEYGSDEMTEQLFEAFKMKLTLAVEARAQLDSKGITDFLRRLHALSVQFEFCSTYANFPVSEEDCEMLWRDRRAALAVTSAKLLTYIDGEVSLNEAAVSALSESADLASPTSVLVVMGQPGLGKSTLLNHIVKACLRLDSVPKVFKTGNTTTHTTRECELLPSTLHLERNLQLLVMDLEGLGGVETQDERLRTMQRLLVAAIAALASVPCFVVKNELHSLEFVEEKLRDIASHKREFGYAVEKIILLFHDKDLAAGRNEYLDQGLRELQEKYGLRDTEFLVLNKPNFVAASRSQVEVFLKRLLDAAKHPKRRVDGSLLDMRQVLTKLSEIVDSCKNVSDLVLTDEERNEVERRCDSISKELVRMELDTMARSTDDSVAQLFQDRVQDLMRRELREQRVGVRRVLESRTLDLAAPHLAALRTTETLARQVTLLPAAEVARTAFRLDPTGRVVLASLSKARYHYPVMDNILRAIQQYKRIRTTNLVVWRGIVGVAVMLNIALLLGAVQHRTQIWSFVRPTRESLLRNLPARLSALFSISVISSALHVLSPVPQETANLARTKKAEFWLGLLQLVPGALGAFFVSTCVQRKTLSLRTGLVGLAAGASALLVHLAAQKTHQRGSSKALFVPADCQCGLADAQSALVVLTLGAKSERQMQFVQEFARSCYPYSLLPERQLNLTPRISVLPLFYAAGSRLAQVVLISIDLKPAGVFETPFEATLSTALLSEASQCVFFPESALELTRVVEGVHQNLEAKCVIVNTDKAKYDLRLRLERWCTSVTSTDFDSGFTETILAGLNSLPVKQMKKLNDTFRSEVEKLYAQK